MPKLKGGNTRKGKKTGETNGSKNMTWISLNGNFKNDATSICIKALALLDNSSCGTFIKENLIYQLGVE